MTLADLVGRICAGLIQQTIFLMVGLVVSQPLSAAPQDGPEFHGRLMIDFPGLDTRGDDPRSLRLKISGKLPARIDWKAQFEAGSLELDFKEFYLDGALGNHARARAGQFREPMGLNLHFTSRSRLMLHYQRSQRIGAGGGLDQLLIRVQMRF